MGQRAGDDRGSGVLPAAARGGLRAGLRRIRNRVAGARVRRLRLADWAPVPTLAVPAHPVAAAAVPAIDAHNHLGRWLSSDGSWMEPDVGRAIDMMDRANVRTVVNLDGRWGAELAANLDRYDRPHPGRFATFCHVDWAEFTRTGRCEPLVRMLREGGDAGAVGLKVWKDLGFSVRDPGGELVLPDDPRLGDLWDAAGELQLPVLMHTGDPAAFFRPVDRHNERIEELTRWPGLRRHGRPPALGRLLDAFESVVERHPDTTFIGAHVANRAEDLAAVGALLDRCPNLVVDLSARASELGRQPRAARELILAHPDRVLFGTDVFPLRSEEWAVYFRLLETEDEHFAYSASEVPVQGRWRISGLGLPPEVLEAVYRTNARRVITRLPG
ncbi:MAG: amidohydrolase family protein [Microthrixaceae bacterium]